MQQAACFDQAASPATASFVERLGQYSLETPNEGSNPVVQLMLLRALLLNRHASRAQLAALPLEYRRVAEGDSKLREDLANAIAPVALAGSMVQAVKANPRKRARPARPENAWQCGESGVDDGDWLVVQAERVAMAKVLRRQLHRSAAQVQL